MRAFVSNCAERLPERMKSRKLLALLRAQPHHVFLDGNFFPGHESSPSLLRSDRDSELTVKSNDVGPLAASGPMPPALAAHFTVGQLAVLRIVGDEVRANGSCALTLAEIGARARASA